MEQAAENLERILADVGCSDNGAQPPHDDSVMDADFEQM